MWPRLVPHYVDRAGTGQDNLVLLSKWCRVRHVVTTEGNVQVSSSQHHLGQSKREDPALPPWQHCRQSESDRQRSTQASAKFSVKTHDPNALFFFILNLKLQARDRDLTKYMALGAHNIFSTLTQYVGGRVDKYVAHFGSRALTVEIQHRPGNLHY